MKGSEDEEKDFVVDMELNLEQVKVEEGWGDLLPGCK